MPGPLTNEGHELFAKHLAEGAEQHEAWLKAGFEGGPAVASRASKRPEVRARILELQTAAAAETVVTIADIARQLDEDREFARKCATPAAMVSATMGKAKVLGLIRDRVEHTGANGGPIQTEQVNSDADAFTRAIAGLAARAEAGSGAGETQH